MTGLQIYANLFIFLSIVIVFVLLIFSIAFRGIRKGMVRVIYYASLIIVFCGGMLANFSIIGYLIQSYDGNFIRFGLIVLIVVILFLQIRRYEKYSQVNYNLQRPIIYIDLFMTGMLLANLYTIALDWGVIH